MLIHTHVHAPTDRIDSSLTCSPLWLWAFVMAGGGVGGRVGVVTGVVYGLFDLVSWLDGQVRAPASAYRHQYHDGVKT